MPLPEEYLRQKERHKVRMQVNKERMQALQAQENGNENTPAKAGKTKQFKLNNLK